MSSTAGASCELRYWSRVLGRHVVLTARDLRTLQFLYTYIRVDFHQLCHLQDIEPDRSHKFQRRLSELTKAGFIFTYGSPWSANPMYGLIEKGLNVHLQQQAARVGVDPQTLERRRLKYPINPDAERLRKHETGVAATAILFNQAVEGVGGVMLSHRDLQYGAPSKAIQSGQGLPVAFTWKGAEKTYRLKSDYISGAYFTDRPVGANARYFAIEFDCGTEDIDPSNPFSGKQNIARKLYLYEAAIEAGLFAEHYGIEVIRPMFVFPSIARRDHVVELAQEILQSHDLKKLFHFGVAPQDWYRCDYTSLDWINGVGKRVVVRL